MNFKGKIPFIIIAGFAWVVIISSCANQGMPTGGPRDTIPPVLAGTLPKYKALNYKGDEVRLTFNEYIDPAEVMDALVVSPPLTKRPTVRTKSKSLIVQFNENLQDSTTYSLDFKNSVVDNNERNPYKNFRFSFSTGTIFDSLRVAGKVINAFNLEPVENTLVMLHKNLHDSAVFKVRPDYIAKTDETGLFMIDNIAPGKYHVFSINDANSDLLYNEGAEDIAFLDTLVVPSAQFHEELDTLVKGVDSMLILGHTHFLPKPFYLRQFTEDIFEQYLDSYKRPTRNKCNFVFNESVNDTFKIKLINSDATDWYLLEPNEKMDSLTLWINDTVVAKMDTLLMELSYYQLDSMNQLYVQKDILELNFTEKADNSSKKKKKLKKNKEDAPKPIPQFNWQTNASSSNFDLNKALYLTAPEPVAFFDSTMVHLFLTDDTLKTALNFKFEKDTIAWHRYKISYPWEPKTSYTLKVDSAACTNIYGITSMSLEKNFSTREKDFYGTIQLQLTNVKGHKLLQLLKNTDEEEVLIQKETDKDKTVIFDYLAPAKYKIKIIYDDNGNGKWDTGSFQDKYQPEKVSYINEVIKVRSNWDKKFPWDLSLSPSFNKNIRDKELEVKKRKEAEEKARQEKKNRNKSQGQQNNMFQQGSGGSGRMLR
ncbi:MAG: Ig-like domain-containing protein [Prolixibacteraceae bacterium]|nr:Ig-like domain-containing protein [Prolixibacteraceae bacterium]